MLSVRTKILLIAIACVLACLATFTIATIENSRSQLETSETQILQRIYNSHNDTLWVMQEGCEGILATIAARPDVREALITGDREQLLQELTPVFSALREAFDVVQFYVYKSDGTVLLRVHDARERGDSYASQRGMVLDALRTRLPTSGIELDARLLGMRTVVPVLNGDQVEGLLEIGRNYDQRYLDDLRRRRDAEYRVWLLHDAAGAAGLWPTGQEPAAPSRQLFYYASTFHGERMLPPDVYEGVLASRVPAVHAVTESSGHYSTLVAALRGYGGRLLGLLEISRSREEALATFKSQLATTVTLAAGVALAGILLLAVFLDFGLLRPLRILTAAARRQYEGDIMARVQHTSSDEFGQLASTFNRLSNRLTDTLKKQQQTIEELGHARRVAEEASAAKDQFLATLSHELRTPLTPVLLTAESLEQSTRLPPDLADDAHTIRRNVQLEARLIDDLLDLTRVATGKLEMRLRPCEVHSLLAAAVAVCQTDFAAKNITLQTSFLAPEQFVMADPSRLQQVFWNLIKNAVKFTGSGGQIAIRTFNQQTANLCTQVVIEIRDSGIGMKPDVLARIFNVFEQGDRAITRTSGGLGLGLAISKAIVDLHAGRIAASSAGEGKGAVFTIELPAAEPEPQAAATPGERPVQAPPEGLRILFVEDHVPTARIVKRLLERLGHHPQVACDLACARKLAAEQEFDLVISDLGLPDGHGTELVQELRRRRPLRAIAMSGFGMHEDVARCMAAGFTRHLTKPITAEQLQDAIAAVMACAPAAAVND